MFERLLTICMNNHYRYIIDPSLLLQTQYRCHPIIGNLASQLFYQNQLQNGESTNSIPFILSNYPRLVFINNLSRESSQGGIT